MTKLLIAIIIVLTARCNLLNGRCKKMMSSQETTRMVELLTTAAKLPDKMQALALGYAKGLADAEKLHKQSQPAQGGKSA